MRYLLIALSLTVVGCHHNPRVAYGNEATVQVSNLTSRNERRAFALAERHCQQYKRIPRIVADQGKRITFDCVTP